MENDRVAELADVRERQKKCTRSETQGLNYEHPLFWFWGRFTLRRKNCHHVSDYWDEECVVVCLQICFRFMVILCVSNTSYRMTGRDY